MAQTTIYTINKRNGVAIAKNATKVGVKPNTGTLKSWRVYFSADNSFPPQMKSNPDDPGELHSGNCTCEYENFTGTMYIGNGNSDDPIKFAVTVEGGDVI